METDSMEKVMEKASVLIEALPYIQRFNRKIIVVKYGGSAMVDENLKKQVIQDCTLLKLVGFKPVIVHGGGKEISRWVEKAGMTPEFINGLRVTDEATMEIAEMVLNRVNKSLVQMVESLGVHAIGISGKDGKLLEVDKKLSNGQDIGFVGEVKKVNPEILYDLLEKDFLPLSVLSVWMMISIPITSMQMMPLVRSQRPLRQRNWPSLPISKASARILRIRQL